MFCRICGEPGFWIYDGHGIELAPVCGSEKCEKEVLKGFRPDILSGYQCDEPIESED